jgi:hypothetical protein
MNFKKITAFVRISTSGIEKLALQSNFAKVRIEAYSFDSPEFDDLPLAVFRLLEISATGKVVRTNKWGILHTRTGGILLKKKCDTRAEAVDELHRHKENVMLIIKDPTKLIRNLSKFHSAVIIEVNK